MTKLISTEMLMSILVTVFLVGGSWSSMSNDMAGVQGRQEKLEGKQESTDENVQGVRQDLAVLKYKVEQQAKEQQEQGQDIKTILRILQDNQPLD